jgi:hypothetical protein
MANSLGRNLKKGDKLVLNDGIEAVAGGELFGSMSFTAGRALDVEINGQNYRRDGYDIDAAETERRFGKENGWT